MSASSRLAAGLCSLLLASTSIGCAAVDVPGESKADPALKEDVADALKQWELGYGCSTLWLSVVDTRLVAAFDGRRSVEKWIVQSCNGEVHAYEVSLMPTADGGTDIGIRKWPE
jgi:hypothetical protein